ncbi:MAG: TonB family protein [Candidatus Acidiferrales bacterium]
MAPLTKDTLEVANSVGETATSHATNQPKSTSGHMRSDAVSLEVPVRVHGSKVTEVVLGTTPHTEPFEEQTSTMIIFPQGGVLRMNTPVTVGQMLVLTNLKTRQDAICRVLKVRPNAKLAAYIEVEFTQRQQGYWGVYFPSDSDPAADKIVTSAPAISAGPESKEKPAADISWAPAPSILTSPKPLSVEPISKDVRPVDAPPPPVQRFVPAAKPEPSFISIGSQEEVQPAASATSQVKSKPETSSPPAPKGSAPIDFPAAPPIAPAALPSISELQGDHDSAVAITAHDSEAIGQEVETSVLAAASSSENPRGTFGSFAGGNALAATHDSTSDDFGARLDSGFGASADQAAQPRLNWMLIAAIAAMVIVVLGGGLFFRSRTSNSRAASSNTSAVAQQTPQPAPVNSFNPPTSNSVTQQATAVPTSVPQPSTTNGAPPASSNANSVGAAKPVASPPSHPVAVAKPVAPKVTSGMMSESLSAHPMPAQRSDPGGADVAPALDAPVEPGAGSAALAGITSASHIPTLAPPTIQPEQPVRIGGNVKEPRLISSVLPVYPIGARQLGLEGDVVVNTTIDKIGNVVKMHVASGPPLLRQAALDAVRRWKYEPSMLDGQPVAVEMQVTIKFRR